MRVPPVHKLPAVPAGEAVTWRLGFRVLGFGTLTFQAFVMLPAKSAVLPGAAPGGQWCRAYTLLFTYAYYLMQVCPA